MIVRMARLRDIRRVDFGYFVRPAGETGTGRPRVEPVLGYAVALDEGLLLFDTGMGQHPEVDEHYRPVRRPLERALGEAGFAAGDVRMVVNCHLHFDHCGGNPMLAGRPIYVQASELEQARTVPDYTLPSAVDFDGASYQELAGEAEIAAGVWVIPTLGHTRGHQSLAVRCPDGTVVLAGQSHDVATDFGADQLAWQARADGVAPPLPDHAAWIDRLMRFDPRRVVFAHDQSVWEPARGGRRP
jgi:glyoxylase-like metal-dependent hydrolase (beta-lactamase superfamily II)